MKRIFAMVLVVCMTLTLLPVSALAARSSREDQPLAEIAKGEEILDRAEEAAAKPAAATDARLAATEDGNVAELNGTGYATLQAAIDAAGAGQTVTLLKDVVLDKKLEITQPITLNLNGHKISRNPTKAISSLVVITANTTIQDTVGTGAIETAQFQYNGKTYGTAVNASGVELTIKSGTIDGGKIGIAGKKSATINLTGGAVKGRTGVDMQGGTITVSDQALVDAVGYGISLQNANENDAATAATLTMTGGAVKANTTDGQAITGNNLYSQGTVATISGGTVTGGTGVYWPMGGTLTVSGDAQIEGTLAGIEAKQGTINITGGTVKATGEYKEYEPSGNGTVGSGWALAVSTQQYATTVEGVSPDVVVSITGGDLISEQGTAIETINMGLKETDGSISVSGDAKVTAAKGKDAIHTASGNVAVAGDQNVALTVEGGTFSSDVSKYCVEGFKAQQNKDGTYGIVEKTYVAQITREDVDEPLKFYTLQEAITAAGADDTITLLQDVNLTKAIQLNKSVKIDGGANKYALSSTAPGGRMFEAMNNSGYTAIEMTNVTLKIKANGTYGAVPFYNHKTDGVLHFSFADGSIVAAEEENVYLVNLFQGQNVKYTFTGNTVAVPAQGLLVNMADDSAVTNNTIDLKGEAVAANSKRTGVISVNEKNVTKGITVTGNTFKNANRVLGVDHAVGLTNDNLTFKDNAMIDCRWAFELNPEAQSGFDLSENYYKFGEEEPGVLRVENSEAKGSHFEFGNETGTEYVLTGTNNAVTVSSYYTDEEMTDLVEFAAQVIAVADGAVTSYATVAEALAASNPGDTVKVLRLDETVVDGQFAPIAIPDGKAVQLTCGEKLAAAFREQNIDPAVYLPAYFTYQARTRSNGGRNAFTLYGGVESTLTGENAIRTKGAANGTTFGVTIVDLLQNWTLKGNVTLPSRDATTTSIYALADVTVDLNGNTLEQEPSALRDPSANNSTTAGWDGYPAIIAYNDKTVTVKDSSANKTGKVIGSAQTFDVYPGATLNLESGTFTTKGNWYNVNNYGGFGSIVRMDGGTLNISGGVLAIPKDNDAHSVKMAATIMLRGKVAENPTRAYAINITGGVIGTVPESKRAPESFKTVYSQTDGFVAINRPVITDETNPDGKNITYAITGGTFDMELQGAKDATEKPYLGDSYESPANGDNAFTVAAKKVATVLNADGSEKATYPSLAAAVAAAENGETVKLLKDASGSGVIVNQSITIDFDTHTYTVNKAPLAGSTGTQSQAFQLLAGADKLHPNTVTMKNGTIVLTSDTPNLQMGIQNYTNLTLEGMTLDASGNANISYVLSNNNGSTTITGGTVLKAAEGNVAFDVYDYSSNGYGNVTVTVDNATVVGKIEVSQNEKATLKISGGTFTADVDKYCVTGKCQDPNQNGGQVGNHALTHHEEAPATCVATGTKEYWSCSVCGKNFADKDGATVLTDLVIPVNAAAHNLTHHAEVPATCTEAGTKEYWSCADCHKNFADEGGATELADLTVNVLGHDLTKWAHDDVNHWHVCSRCDADVTDTPAAHTWVQGAVSGGRRTDTCECGAERTVSVSTGGNNRPRPTPPEEDLNEPDVPLVEKPFLFTDVTADDWYYDAVKYVSAANMMIGVNAEGTLFAPALSTTRASVAQILFRLEKEPTAPIADFDDVREGAWYTDAVNWNDEVGLMVGYGDGTFRPDVNVTREQLVTVLYRYAKHLGLDVTADGDLSAFDDADEVAAWAEDAMAWAVNVGIIKGRNGTRLAPDGTASRSELASILQRFQKLTAAEKD